MPRDRFLIGILSGVGGLILLALFLFFFRSSRVTYLDDPSPSAVVHNYILALQQGDYRRAYSYLADSPSGPSFSQFQEPFLTQQAGEVTNTPVEIGETLIDEQTQSAVVQITLIHGGRGFLEDIYRDPQMAHLVRQGTAWKITSLPYPFFSFDWPLTVTPVAQPKPKP